MRNIKLFIILLISVFAFGFTSCETYFNPEGGTNIVVVGHVFDSDGSTPLEYIKVESNYGETKTNHEGYFEILSYYMPWDDEHALTFEKKVKSAEYKFHEDTSIKIESNKIILDSIHKEIDVVLE